MAFYKRPNPNLERLVALLGIAKPSHGYTIAEDGNPEVVTAPGVYFPAESGEVVPLRPPSIPGIPKPPTERSYGMLPEASKLGGSNFMWQKGNVRTTSRQAGGTVNPTAWDVRRRQGPGLWMGDIGEEPSVSPPIETPPSSYVYPDIPPNTLTPLRPAPAPTPPPASQEEQGILQRLFQLFSRQYGGQVLPPNPQWGLSYNERTSRYGSPLGTSIFTNKQTEPDLYERLKTASGSFDMASTVPMQTQTTLQNPPMQPTANKLEPDLYDRLKAASGSWNMTPLEQRQYGGRVYPPTPESEELEARRRWEQPGYAEEALRRARSEVSPTISSVSPGFERTYYEAHPEERIMEQIEASNKPTMDIMQRAIEDARTRAQGYGVGFPSGRYDRGRIGAGERMLQAEKELPGLMQNLSQLKGGETEAATRTIGALAKEPKMPTPHLVQTDQGPVWAYPPSPTSRGGVLPIGVTPPEKTVSSEQLVRGDLRTKLGREPTSGEILNEIDRRKLEFQMGGIKPLPAGTTAAPKGMKNEAVLEGLTEEQKGIVRGMSEYKYPWPGSFAMKDPKWQALMGRIEMYDPSFDAKEYQVRYRLRQDFTSGKAAQNIRSLNTAVTHLDTLAKKAEALNNAPIQVWNTIKNKGLTATGDKRVTEFNNAVTAVSGELASVFKGTTASGTDQEIKNWRGNVNSSQSPEQLRGNIDTVIELMFGRLGALRSQYEAGMGQMKDFPILSTRSRTILEKLGADVNAVEPPVQTSTEKYSQEDLEFTAKKHGITIEEVKKRLGVGGK